MKTRHKIIPISLPTPFPIGDVFVYVVKGETVTLIDAGSQTKEALHELKGQLERNGLALSDIDQVILTHHHADHIGLLDELPEHTRIIGHPNNQPYTNLTNEFMQKEIDYFYQLFQSFGVPEEMNEQLRQFRKAYRLSTHRPLTQAVNEGDKIEGLEEWEIYYTPGHAGSHIVLYRGKDRLMLGGDVLLKRISSNPFLEIPKNGGTRPRPLLDYKRSLKRLANLEINQILPGHGEAVDRFRELVAKRLQKQERRAKEVLGFLHKEPLTPYEACQMLFPNKNANELFMTMSETVGQLDVLENLGAVETFQEKDTVYYQAKQVKT
jgi:glyoxylase-like metal-dependent hydrolase (beta-lactamase superfamily II)